MSRQQDRLFSHPQSTLPAHRNHQHQHFPTLYHSRSVQPFVGSSTTSRNHALDSEQHSPHSHPGRTSLHKEPPYITSMSIPLSWFFRDCIGYFQLHSFQPDLPFDEDLISFLNEQRSIKEVALSSSLPAGSNIDNSFLPDLEKLSAPMSWVEALINGRPIRSVKVITVIARRDSNAISGSISSLERLQTCERLYPLDRPFSIARDLPVTRAPLHRQKIWNSS